MIEVRTKIGLFALFFYLVLTSCHTEEQLDPEQLLEQPGPLPEVLEYVSPEPGNILTQFENEVCVSINLYPLLEPNDNLTSIENVEMTVNGDTLSNEDTTRLTVDALTFLLDEDNQVIATGPALVGKCWPVILSAGIHIAAIRLWSTSGKQEYSYRWAFEILE
jgi:hypothetical protein